METIAFRMVLYTMEALPTLPLMRKWWDFMADIMHAGEGNVPAQAPLVPLFHLV